MEAACVRLGALASAMQTVTHASVDDCVAGIDEASDAMGSVSRRRAHELRGAAELAKKEFDGVEASMRATANQLECLARECESRAAVLLAFGGSNCQNRKRARVSATPPQRRKCRGTPDEERGCQKCAPTATGDANNTDCPIASHAGLLLQNADDAAIPAMYLAVSSHTQLPRVVHDGAGGNAAGSPLNVLGSEIRSVPSVRIHGPLTKGVIVPGARELNRLYIVMEGWRGALDPADVSVLLSGAGSAHLETSITSDYTAEGWEVVVDLLCKEGADDCRVYGETLEVELHASVLGTPIGLPPLQLRRMMEDSNILRHVPADVRARFCWTLATEWLQGAAVGERIYLATRDGMGPRAFNTHCCGKGATLLLVQVNVDGGTPYVFGGFRPTPWVEKHGDPGSTPGPLGVASPVLFSVVGPTATVVHFPRKPNHFFTGGSPSGERTYTYGSGPMFGSGDLDIWKAGPWHGPGRNAVSSSCGIGKEFATFEDTLMKGNASFTGTVVFDPDEVEVFRVRA